MSTRLSRAPKRRRSVFFMLSKGKDYGKGIKTVSKELADKISEAKVNPTRQAGRKEGLRS